ncbi:MAG: crossover junction endodeoxyribonuclease RuvC [Myxococcaceae bacterium]
MRVLGIDPGSRFMGYGIVEEGAGQPRYVGHGVLKVDATQALELRLKELFDGLTLAFSLYRPQAVAVEGLFTFKNARSALVLGHARGVALLVAAQTGLPVFEYSPARVKKSVGAGGADGKDAVARMVTTFLKLPELERYDASDALAVALCHLNQARGGRLPAAPSRSGKKRNVLSLLEDRLTPSYQRFGENG